MPILSCVCIEAGEGGRTVRVFATDLESAFRTEFPLTGARGRVVVSLDVLSGALAGFDGSAVLTVSTEGGMVHVRSGLMQASMPGESPGNYPRISSVPLKSDWQYRMDGHTLATQIDRTLWSLAQKSQGQNDLQSLNLVCNKGYLYLYSSNLTALTKMILGICYDPPEANVTIPAGMVRRMMRAAEIAPGDVVMHLIKPDVPPANDGDPVYSQLRLEAGLSDAAFRVTRGRYCDPDEQLPDTKKIVSMAYADDALLSACLKRMIKVADPVRTRGEHPWEVMVTLAFGEDRLRISMKSARRCAAMEDSMPCELGQGEPFETTVDARELVGALASDSACGRPRSGRAKRETRSLFVYFGDKAPMILRSVEETTKSYIIMSTADKR
jgi:hypothetical protein